MVCRILQTEMMYVSKKICRWSEEFNKQKYFCVCKKVKLFGIFFEIVDGLYNFTNRNDFWVCKNLKMVCKIFETEMIFVSVKNKKKFVDGL